MDPKIHNNIIMSYISMHRVSVKEEQQAIVSIEVDRLDIHASPVLAVKLKVIVVNRSSVSAVHRQKLLGFSRVSHDWQGMTCTVDI